MARLAHQPGTTTESSLLSPKVMPGYPRPGRVEKQLPEMHPSLFPTSEVPSPCTRGSCAAQKASGSSVPSWRGHGKSCVRAICTAAKFISRFWSFAIIHAVARSAGVHFFAKIFSWERAWVQQTSW